MDNRYISHIKEEKYANSNKIIFRLHEVGNQRTERIKLNRRFEIETEHIFEFRRKITLSEKCLRADSVYQCRND